jgi:Tol biopolymer transport system component
MRRSACLAIALALGACGRIGFDPTSRVGDGGVDPDAVAACTSWGPFGTPQIIPELVSDATDWAPSVSRDGKQMLFSSARAGTQDLYVSTRASTTDDWSAPTLLDGFDTSSSQEDDPTISNDQLEIYFGKNELRRATRSNPSQAFGPSDVIVPGSAAFELVQGAELSSDNLRLYFSAGATASKLYVMERASLADEFTTFAEVDIASTDDIGYPTLSSDGLELIVSQAVGGPQDRDLFVSRRATTSDPFPAPVPIAELASNEEDWDPELSADGSTLWFASTRPPAMAQDVFVTTRTCLD